MTLLVIFGVLTGFVSGFFGIGGGTLLIPLLLYSGFVMKEAVSISVMQMVFSSIYGSYLNAKQNKNLLKSGIVIGIGGFFGGLLSGFIVSNVSNEFLEYSFLFILFFAIFRLLKSSPIGSDKSTLNNKLILFIIGFFVGIIAMSIGVGGSIMITPIVSSYLHFPLKDAASLGLFFVVFSSVAGFGSLSFAGEMLYLEGAIIGISSLLGVLLGVILKSKTNASKYKKIVLVLYIVLALAMVNRILL
ncbi:MAG: sulfite exporter TauE/SafE family protein [Arcobacteraceae bacterium]|nr:sulfite exporter TauE/SafE family protein [Arcobacteraceae bacterium]